jgi:hypothetical protein
MGKDFYVPYVKMCEIIFNNRCNLIIALIYLFALNDKHKIRYRPNSLMITMFETTKRIILGVTNSMDILDLKLLSFM